MNVANQVNINTLQTQIEELIAQIENLCAENKRLKERQNSREALVENGNIAITSVQSQFLGASFAEGVVKGCGGYIAKI